MGGVGTMCLDGSNILFVAYSELKSVKFIRTFPNYVCISFWSKN
jgi:hypothetical protein